MTTPHPGARASVSPCPALRRELESLLANDAAARSFCETPAAALLASVPATSAQRRFTMWISTRRRSTTWADYSEDS